ncbi:4-hydroxythreonine-4-phosphate dehydrogenase [Marinifilum caeruleilacunae]|uniref:4-hydroxythreonine-4-phosphate dehydrogenase n=1 Tax=Marinifilum caeruleilacunae TaxID=2499076 RepID=A0ABX1X0X5_9BACT|nr:4-hydroxythreonine-4-phosphate dehydrogenase [Marinifilum caeruleilacunae]NOU62017.1 4-hydroxythreonine-4-phosphate dehydrogenase [Marinifilum caeruleilacunae]
MSIDLIFMLTKDDKTVPDARRYVKEIVAEGVKHIGFKDVGLPFNELKALTSDLRAEGVKVYLEVVSLDENTEKKSAMIAMDLNVDYLLGGTRPELIAPIVKDHPLKYYPFVGKVVGHPSVLEGSIHDIAAQAKKITSLEGVDGLDLLAYRHTGEDIPQLIQEVSKHSLKPIIVAGSIDSVERVETVKEIGVSAFTVGTAAFEQTFPSTKPGVAGQVEYILKKC